MESLTHLKILITRPQHQAENLQKQIVALGGTPLLFPTLEIVSMNESITLPVLSRLAEFDIAIFISPNAVFEAIRLLQKHHLQWPVQIKTLAVGASTAIALQERGLSDVIYPATEFNTEGLLRLPELQIVAAKKIVLICGAGGRDQLAKTLKNKGAELIELAIYRRILPITKPSAAVLHNEIDVIVSTSMTGLKNLLQLVDEVGRSRLKNMSLLVVSDRMAEEAKGLGFIKSVIVAENATDSGIIKALVDWRELQNGKCSNTSST